MSSQHYATNGGADGLIQTYKETLKMIGCGWYEGTLHQSIQNFILVSYSTQHVTTGSTTAKLFLRTSNRNHELN